VNEGRPGSGRLSLVDAKPRRRENTTPRKKHDVRKKHDAARTRCRENTTLPHQAAGPVSGRSRFKPPRPADKKRKDKTSRRNRPDDQTKADQTDQAATSG
jgi:hypothetical protein